MHRLTELSLRAPWATLMLSVLVSLASFWAYARAPFMSGADGMIGPDAPASRELDRFIAQFGVGYPVLVGWSCGEPGDPCASVFDPSSLRMAKELGDALAQEPSVKRVSSLAHTPLLLGTSEGIFAHRFVTDGRIEAPAELVARALLDAQCFLTMNAARFASAANAGKLSAVAIAAAALSEMLLLPALIVLSARVRVPAWLRRLAWSG
jgi:predicted RND superfamily exporter protein